MLVKCPSGLAFETSRTWKLGDRKILMNRQIVAGGLLLHKMLEAVTDHLVDPGPYQFPGDSIEWGMVANIDIVTATIDVRAATRPEFEFNKVCDYCPKTMPLMVNLSKMDRGPMSEEGKKYLREGKLIERLYRHTQYATDDLDDPGAQVGPAVHLKLRLLRGSDHLQLMRLQKEESEAGMLEVQNCLHIVEMRVGDGETWTGDKDFRKIRKFYANADWDFQESLDMLINEVSGGVKTDIEVVCRSCSGEQTIPLPFSLGFFIPQRVQRSSFSRVGSNE